MCVVGKDLMSKDRGMGICKTIVLSFLPCLVVFWDSHLLYLFISKMLFVTFFFFFFSGEGGGGGGGGYGW